MMVMSAKILPIRRNITPEQVEAAMAEVVRTLMYETSTTDPLPVLMMPVGLGAVLSDLAIELGMAAPAFTALMY